MSGTDDDQPDQGNAPVAEEVKEVSIPISLAYTITIYKNQRLSFSNSLLDVSNFVFSCRQA